MKTNQCPYCESSVCKNGTTLSCLRRQLARMSAKADEHHARADKAEESLLLAEGERAQAVKHLEVGRRKATGNPCVCGRWIEYATPGLDAALALLRGGKMNDRCKRENLNLRLAIKACRPFEDDCPIHKTDWRACPKDCIVNNALGATDDSPDPVLDSPH